MKYPNIKAAKISHAQIAKAFGYANVKSFRTSSAHQRHMQGIEAILEIQNNSQSLKERKIKLLADITNLTKATCEWAESLKNKQNNQQLKNDN